MCFISAWVRRSKSIVEGGKRHFWNHVSYGEARSLLVFISASSMTTAASLTCPEGVYAEQKVNFWGLYEVSAQTQTEVKNRLCAELRRNQNFQFLFQKKENLFDKLKVTTVLVQIQSVRTGSGSGLCTDTKPDNLSVMASGSCIDSFPPPFLSYLLPFLPFCPREVCGGWKLGDVVTTRRARWWSAAAGEPTLAPGASRVNEEGT